MNLRFLIFLLVIILLCLNCNSVDPPPKDEKPGLELTLEDVSCIEAWVTLTTTNLELPASIFLKRNDQIIKTINLVKADTLLYIDSLLPNTNYTFQTTIQTSSCSSNELSVTTMDTTSHEFTFETFTFGGTAGTSTLYDVAIISPDNIYAVGEILIADTSQNGYSMYNAVHWDGSQWELKKITVDFRGNLITPPLEGVSTFSATDIWFVGSLPIHGDGENWMMYDLRTTVDPNITVSKAWGSSSNDMYYVGRNGNIVRYYNDTWSKIESGTDLNIGDIWGIPDGSGGYNKYLAADNAMLKIDNNNQLSRINGESGMILNSVWGISNRLIYTAGDGIVLYKNNNWEKINKQGVNTIYIVRGQNYNDVCGIGSPGSIIHHFSGYSWQSINPNPNNRYRSIDIKENIIVASGYQGEKAAITIIKRNN